MGQKIDFAAITACGECCVGCKKKLDGLCNGCIESDGHVPELAQVKGFRNGMRRGGSIWLSPLEYPSIKPDGISSF